MEHKYLCLSCYMEQREVYSVEQVNVPPVRRECDGCHKKKQCWKYKVFKAARPKKSTGNIPTPVPSGIEIITDTNKPSYTALDAGDCFGFSEIGPKSKKRRPRR